MKDVIVLCEDKQHSVFITRFLSLGKKRDKRPQIYCAPEGRGDAANYVCEEYPRLLDFTRTKSGVSLIVMIDADMAGAKARSNQLALACKQQGIRPDKQGKRIAVFFPARNIETWIKFLESGQKVDESVSYPKLDRENQCKPQVKKLHDMCARGQLPANAPDSLKAACKEWKRLP